MKITAVIVTYGERTHLLKQVVDACFAEGVGKVLVVDNASCRKTRDLLEQYRENNLKFNAIFFDRNMGSAGGYKTGIEAAYKDADTEFIWLLDDDNVPSPGSLRFLKERFLFEGLDDPKLCLKSFRVFPGSENSFETSVLRHGKESGPDKLIHNTYNGYSLLKAVYSFKSKLFKPFQDPVLREEAVISRCAYGGMFLNKKIIDLIGLPDERFYLYSDDVDFSYRITAIGGRIILLRDSKITDMAVSDFELQDPDKIYYLYRNRVIYEKQFISNNFVYTLTKYLEKTRLLLKFLVLKREKQKFKIITKALKDGENGITGKIVIL